jgi:iron complex outermembrane receptor protein
MSIYIAKMFNHSLSAWLLFSLMGIFSLSVSASKVLDKQQQFNLGSMPLTESLLVFSEQSGLQILFSSVDVANLSSPELRGYQTLHSALTQLISSGELIFELIDETTLIVKRTEELKNSQSAVPAVEKSSSWTLEEVMVTAQRRNENSQNVPMSVMTLSAEALEKMSYSNISDISDKIPSLSFQPDFVKTSSLKVYIRGVGQEKPASFARDNGVGIYLDDIYVGHGNAMASKLNNDLERIEVLSGPQGILYGRNTIGGAVKFISAKPTGEFGFKQKIDVGNFGLFRTVSTLNLAAVNNLSSKISMLRINKDGWVKNTGSAGNPGDKTATDFSASLRWAPSEDWLVDYVYDQVKQDSISNYQQHSYAKFATNLTGFEEFSKRQDKTWRPINVDIHDDFKARGHALTAEWNITDGMMLKSISGYRDFKSATLHDGAESYNVSTLVASEDDQEQYSQEFLLSGNNLSNSLKYHLGLYYFEESVEQKETSLLNQYELALAINNALLSGDPIVAPAVTDLKLFNTFHIKNRSQAVYAQITWTPAILQRRLMIDLGARFTEDNRYLGWHKPTNAGGPFAVNADDSVSAESFDPAFTVDYSWSADVHTYFRYAQAYRSGGFDTAAERLQAFDAEHLESYELGFKSQLFDDRLLLNLAVFKLDYTDIQVEFFDPGLDVTRPPSRVTINAAEASTRGGEIEIKVLPIDGLIVSASAAYLDSAAVVANPYTGVTADRFLFNTPQLKYNLAVEYSFKPTAIGTFSTVLSYDYRDEELAAGTSDPTDLKPDYGLLAARLTLSAGDLNVALWVKNLADEEYEVYHNFGSVIYGEPRNFGVSLSYSY